MPFNFGSRNKNKKKNVVNFPQCSWCPATNKCSTGTDRNRQDWLQRGCENSQIRDVNMCPAIGTKGNNYGAEQTYVVNGTDVADRFDQSAKDASRLKSDSSNGDVHMKSVMPPFDGDSANPENVGVGMFLGLFLPILLVSCLAIWIFYAYRNPHTKSGQLLIQVSTATVILYCFVYYSLYMFALSVTHLSLLIFITHWITCFRFCNFCAACKGQGEYFLCFGGRNYL